MDEQHDPTTALTKCAPSEHYPRAYRALLEARRLLQDPTGYYAAVPYEERRAQGLSEVSAMAYDRAMKVSSALAVLPEFPPDRCERVYAACWKIDQTTGERGNLARVEATLAEVGRLFDAAARAEVAGAAIVPARSGR